MNKKEELKKEGREIVEHIRGLESPEAIMFALNTQAEAIGSFRVPSLSPLFRDADEFADKKMLIKAFEIGQDIVDLTLDYQDALSSIVADMTAKNEKRKGKRGKTDAKIDKVIELMKEIFED